MKSLMLLNARKRRKSRKSRKATSARRVTRRRRSTRRSTRRTSSAAAAWMSAAGSKRSTRRRSRARRVTVKVRRLGKGSRRSAVVYVRANPRRRSYRRNPFGGGNLLAQAKSIVSKENLTTAAGGIAATVLTNYLLNMKKADNTSVLPLPSDAKTASLVKIGYAVAIPAVGAFVAKKTSPSLAKGMIIGGLINGLLAGLREFAPPTLKATLGLGEYLQYTPTSAVGKLPPSYMAASRFSSANLRPVNGALQNSSAFPSDAWGN